MGSQPELSIRKKTVMVDTFIRLKEERVPLRTIRNGAAKRYILRIHRDGYIQITIPHRGNQKDALVFAHKHLPWLESQWEVRRKNLEDQASDVHQRQIHFRGRLERIEITEREGQTHAQFADQVFPIDLRRLGVKQWVEAWLRFKANEELPDRVALLAACYGFKYNRVTIRDQRTRWGSCSSNRTISLNWRLIQIPDAHRDYIILHELTHLKHMDHSSRFWKSLAALCPHMHDSEAWLKANSRLLRD